MSSSLDRLLQIADGSVEDMALAEAALLIAKQEYPALDVPVYLGKIERLVNNFCRRLPVGSPIGDVFFTLNEYLFDEEGFAGNSVCFYDPRNSFLNNVLDLRLGVPVTLSIIYITIGRSLGIPLQGVSFPGHFLVKYPASSGEGVILDPFSGGVALRKEELIVMLNNVYGRRDVTNTPLEGLLVAADDREIVLRILRNLKQVFLHNNQPEKVLRTIDQILHIAPEQVMELHDRGRLYEYMQCYSSAISDYQRFIDHAPPNSERLENIQNRLIKLKRVATTLH